VKSRSLRIALSLVLSAVCLWLAVRGVDWNETLKALADAKYWMIAPISAVGIYVLYVRAQRWHFFLRKLGHPGMRTLVAATNIGFMANMVLPLRAGEVIRPVLASRREKLPLSGVLATVFLERLFDMFSVLLLLGLAMLLLPVSDRVRGWGLTVTLGSLVVAAGLAFAGWQRELVLGVFRRLLPIAPAALRQPLDNFASGFLRALSVLDSPEAFLRAAGVSFYIWSLIGLTNALGLLAFDLPVPLVVGAIAITPIVSLAVSVPSAPGFIGAYQLGCILSLAIFGVNESHAIAYSIVMNLTTFLACTGAGMYSLWSEGLSFHEIEAVSEDPDVAT
jgi:glycosyltransferase 2 family protein